MTISDDDLVRAIDMMKFAVRETEIRVKRCDASPGTGIVAEARGIESMI